MAVPLRWIEGGQFDEQTIAMVRSKATEAYTKYSGDVSTFLAHCTKKRYEQSKRWNPIQMYAVLESARVQFEKAFAPLNYIREANPFSTRSKSRPRQSSTNIRTAHQVQEVRLVACPRGKSDIVISKANVTVEHLGDLPPAPLRPRQPHPRRNRQRSLHLKPLKDIISKWLSHSRTDQVPQIINEIDRSFRVVLCTILLRQGESIP